MIITDSKDLKPDDVILIAIYSDVLIVKVIIPFTKKGYTKITRHKQTYSTTPGFSYLTKNSNIEEHNDFQYKIISNCYLISRKK